jgi:uncharacterized repeat protein (TIGR01451 family)
MLDDPSCKPPALFSTFALLGLAALLVTMALTVGTLTVHADTLAVTNTNDNGPGSLRQTIADAQPEDAIAFALSYPATITLTSGELVISKSLTIAGPGPDLLAISGNDASRIFRVDKPGETQPIAVTLAGLTIRDGRSDGGGGIWNDEDLTLTDVVLCNNQASHGGGMYNYRSNAVLTHVTFSENRTTEAYGTGGGMDNEAGSPTLTHVIFDRNRATSGAGMYNEAGSPVLTDVTFTRNYGVISPYTGHGMGMVTYEGSPTLINVVFRGNWGGGFGSLRSDCTLINVLFGGNWACGHDVGLGGGMNIVQSSLTLINVTVSGNWACTRGGGIHLSDSTATIQNSILWGNLAGERGDQIYSEVSTPTFTYSDIQGSGGSGACWDDRLGIDGGGNLDVDPRFVDPLDPEATPTTGGDLRLQAGPVVDAGSNSFLPSGVTTDLAGGQRIVNGTVDLGPYELQPGLHLYKSADVAWATPSQTITYTLLAVNTFTDTVITEAIISDMLPAGLLLARPIELEPPEAGVVGTAPPILITDLTIYPEQVITVSLPVTVGTGITLGTTVTNLAAITSSQVLTPQWSAHTLAICATHLTVTSDGDGGPGSLRQAIADLCAAGMIDFSLSYPATITLTEGELVITRPLTIAGPGPALLAVSGNDAGRVFRVDARGGPDQIAATVSGLTIRDGIGGYGGGLWNDECLTLANVALYGNEAYTRGGGMYNVEGSSMLTDVLFGSNQASAGGGMCNESGNPTLTNVIFAGNRAPGSGGGMCNETGNPTLTSVIFAGNWAGWYGGGMYNDHSRPILTNVTFSGNRADSGGGGMYNETGDPTIQNSILWGNSATSGADQIENGSSTPTIAHSDIQASGGSGAGWDGSLGNDGGANLDADPLFLEPIDAAIAPTVTGNLRLDWGSPAINAGDNSLLLPGIATDLDGNPRIAFGIVDMGAYEMQPCGRFYLPIVLKDLEP